jgi:hypothetical protein
MRMARGFLFLLLLLATPALGGCAVQAALTAAELGPQIRGPMGPSNAHLKVPATQACTQRAGLYGTVFVVDVEQRREDRIVVWGSVTDPRQMRRRTFECHFTTSLIRFKLGEPLPPD